MTEERCLRVPYHMFGAASGWLMGLVMMVVATVTNSDELGRWALFVAAGAAVASGWCMLIRSRARMLEAFGLQLRMHQASLVQQDLPRVPTLR